MTGSGGRARLPLAGVRVVVTRAEEADGPLSKRLAERGAEVLNWPVLAFQPPEDPAALVEALGRLRDYDWILFTSPRAVEAVQERAEIPDGRPRIAAVGGSTAGILRRASWPVDLEASPASADALLRAFAEIDCRGCRMLLPASSIARPTLARGLERLGASVDRVTAYRTVHVGLDPERRRALLEGEDPPILTFASPSAISGLAEALGDQELARLSSRCPTVVIGETTAHALAARGISPARIARPSTLDGLAAAVEQVAQEVLVR